MDYLLHSKEIKLIFSKKWETYPISSMKKESKIQFAYEVIDFSIEATRFSHFNVGFGLPTKEGPIGSVAPVSLMMERERAIEKRDMTDGDALHCSGSIAR